MDNLLALAMWIQIIAIVFMVGIFIGDYVIPALIKLLTGKTSTKVKHDYAKKEWIRTLITFKE